MRLAIFSDVHGNLEALKAVLVQVESLGVDRVVCLGDLVGYGADPNACIQEVRRVTDTVVVGNHDRAAVYPEEARHFNPIPLAAIRWTERELSEAHIEYLKERPLTVAEGSALYVHASPQRPEAWTYLFGPEEGRRVLAYTDAQHCFVGHSHHAFICTETGRAEVVGEGVVDLDPAERYLVNVGSVGQPRDGDPRAAFVLWDQQAALLRLCRVPYDVAGAQERIREAHLPAFLAERLSLGR